MSLKRTDRPPVPEPLERMSEFRLISRVAEGDQQAFADLYCAYQVRLGRFVAGLVRHPQLVEEVLDDTLLVVWERAATFKGESKLSTWIFKIAYRKAMKAVRRYDAPVEDHGAASCVSDRPTPEEAYGQKKLHDELCRALTDLSLDHRTVVELTYFNDLGYREIAQIMDCPVDTVKTRMFYARRHLKRGLDGQWHVWI